MTALIVSCLFAATLGFAAHRASVCTVRAVTELTSSRTGYMFLSIAKSSVWVLVVTLPFFCLMPAECAKVSGWSLTYVAILGGFLFGVGAGLNGGCAVSTMARLVDGEMRMLLTVGGFALGVLGYLALLHNQWLTRPVPSAAFVGSLGSWIIAIAIVLPIWAAYELVRLWRTRKTGCSLLQRILAPQYRLSTSAMLIGVAGSAIYLMFGSPGYTATLQNLIESYMNEQHPPALAPCVLLVAVFSGMVVSTIQRGSFRFDWQPRLSWLRNAGGGALMGLGTAMLPGGNDALVLFGIPSLSPHAGPAFATMVIGATAAVWLLRRCGVEMRVVCRDDLYITDALPQTSAGRRLELAQPQVPAAAALSFAAASGH
jgi:uncharacterized membrane protein YedE/YeeE